MTTKLVMTLLVRDEEDIIEQNIQYHLSNGVDFIIAMDNGSKDQTLDILQEYEVQGMLKLIVNRKQTYEQSRWVSEMADLAVKSYGATHLFHCDADEFWRPNRGNLKKDLPEGNVVHNVPVLTYLPEVDRALSFTQDAYIVQKPFVEQMSRLEGSAHKYLLHAYQPKVLTTSAFTKISQGNHLVLDDKEKAVEVSKNIVIHHVPVRSYEQFERKVINGGSSYMRNPNRDPEIGWQWKEWYRLWKKGLLHNVYEEVCVNENERRILQAEGIIKRTKFPSDLRELEKQVTHKRSHDS